MLWLTLVASTLFAHAATPPAAFTAAVEESRRLPLAQRIDNISKSLLGVAYALDPMGEGQPPDTDPIVQYHHFDCLTYVEEVLAFALTNDDSTAQTMRTTLRYGDGIADYSHRHHFMELQWIPANIAKGLLKDISSQLGTTTPLTVNVTAETWQNWGPRRRFSLTDSQLPIGEWTLDVLPLDIALAAISQFPVGSIALTVHTPRAHTPSLVTHLGIIVDGPTPTIRHASSLGGGNIRDTSLTAHIGRLKSAYVNWPMLGIVVLMPQDTAPNRSEPK